MKLNLKVVKKNNEGEYIELVAEDVPYDKVVEVREYMMRQMHIKEIPTITAKSMNNEIKKEYDNSNYKPVSNIKGARASQKQINLIRALGFNEPLNENFSVSEASDLINYLKSHEEEINNFPEKHRIGETMKMINKEFDLKVSYTGCRSLMKQAKANENQTVENQTIENTEED